MNDMVNTHKSCKKYRYTVQAIEAVSGKVDPNTNEVIKLIEKIKFKDNSQEAGLSP